VTETDSDYYRKLHLGLWTALNGGDEVLKWWWFARPVRMSLFVAKNHDVPADTDRWHSSVNYTRGSAALTPSVLHFLFKCSSDQQILKYITRYRDVMPCSHIVAVLPRRSESAGFPKTKF
jgi:hypothetical protein